MIWLFWLTDYLVPWIHRSFPKHQLVVWLWSLTWCPTFCLCNPPIPDCVKSPNSAPQTNVLHPNPHLTLKLYSFYSFIRRFCQTNFVIETILLCCMRVQCCDSGETVSKYKNGFDLNGFGLHNVCFKCIHKNTLTPTLASSDPLLPILQVLLWRSKSVIKLENVLVIQ